MPHGAGTALRFAQLMSSAEATDQESAVALPAALVYPQGQKPDRSAPCTRRDAEA